MKGNLLWRGLLILGLVAVALFLVNPPKDKINLGLDLRGGMHLVLQVHTEDAVRAETDADMETLLQQAEEEELTGLQARRTGDSTFVVSGAGSEAVGTLTGLAERYLPQYGVSRSDGSLVFEMQGQAVNELRSGAVRQAKQTIMNRVDAFGVTEPVFGETGNYRIVVQLPGVDDPDRVRRLIKNTAFLEFRIVEFPQGGAGAPTREAILQNYGGRLPDDLELLTGDVIVGDEIVGQQFYAVQRRRQVTGRDLKTARPSRGEFNRPIVQFSFTPQGADAFGDLTGNNIGKPLAIVLDGKVVSAPRINSRITDQGIIEGNFTEDEVQDLATVLKSGALPASMTTLEERTVGPSLGRDSVKQGLLAGLVGSGLVVLFMLVVYNLSGLNAVFALALNIVLVFGGLSMFNATLTLPGIAGIILTIGMAVDANVLVFERIREELRAGRTVRSAVDLGFQKALSSIVDGNVTTLIAAVFLFQYGTGPIRGFAVTLSIGLLASMFTAVFVSRWLFDTILSRRQVQRLSI
jgi:preprotein translocase subunit SecD